MLYRFMFIRTCYFFVRSLRKEYAGGAWCPKRQIESGVREWLQVDFGSPHVVTAVQTQGRYDHGRGQEYVEEYTLEYWRPGFDEWREYKRWDNRKVEYTFAFMSFNSINFNPFPIIHYCELTQWNAFVCTVKYYSIFCLFPSNSHVHKKKP